MSPIERNENDNDEPREIRRRVKSTSRGFEDSLHQKSKGWKPLLSQPPRGVEGAHTRRQGARASALRSLAQDQARPKTGTLIMFRRLCPRVLWGPLSYRKESLRERRREYLPACENVGQQALAR